MKNLSGLNHVRRLEQFQQSLWVCAVITSAYRKAAHSNTTKNLPIDLTEYTQFIPASKLNS
jgi:hypothetical protein